MDLNAVVVPVTRQYEDGPWWARAFSAEDAAFSFLRTDSSDIFYDSSDELWSAASGNSGDVLDELMKVKAEPLAEALGDFEEAIRAVMEKSNND
ncbi:MAG: hypothetical protein ACXW39_09130, partial [Nitrospira sp.]